MEEVMADSAESSKQYSNTSDNKEEPVEFHSTAAALKDAISETITRCVKEFSREIFAQAFPTIYKSNKKRINELRKSVSESIKNNCLEEVDLIFEERNIEEKLDKLDRAIVNSKCRGKWRPSGDVEQDLRAHLMKKKLEHTKTLNEILKAEKKLTRQLEINNAKDTEQLSKLINKTKQSYDDFMTPSSSD